MLLDLAGNLYPCVFSGWHVVFEVLRGLGDPDRMNLLPRIAERLGLDTTDPSGLWRVKASTVLAEAIWYSFQRAGVTIMADHTAAEQHREFERELERAGLPISAERESIVPPVCAHLMATWGGDYTQLDLLPNFVQ